MENEKTLRLGVIVPEDLLKQAKHLAIESGSTLSEMVRESLEKRVEAAKNDDEKKRAEG
jgi:post-segregation antitoxin (ccd killing protein)